MTTSIGPHLQQFVNPSRKQEDRNSNFGENRESFQQGAYKALNLEKLFNRDPQFDSKAYQRNRYSPPRERNQAEDNSREVDLLQMYRFTTNKQMQGFLEAILIEIF